MAQYSMAAIPRVFVLLLAILTGQSAKKMERMIRRETLARIGRTSPVYMHEVVFAIRQRNLDNLKSLVDARSTPGNSMYQTWLTFDEVGEMTSNKDGALAVESWLIKNNITIISKSRHSDYVKASAKISVWEILFSTTFYSWEDAASDIVSQHTLAEEYSLPDLLVPHVAAVFYTCQAPPRINQNYIRHSQGSSSFKTTVVVDDVGSSTLRSSGNRRLSSGCASSNGAVTVSFLDCFYKISSNTG